MNKPLIVSPVVLDGNTVISPVVLDGNTVVGRSTVQYVVVGDVKGPSVGLLVDCG